MVPFPAILCLSAIKWWLFGIKSLWKQTSDAQDGIKASIQLLTSPVCLSEDTFQIDEDP